MNDTTGEASTRLWMPIRREGLCCRTFDDEAVLYDPAHHAVHYLNRTAWFIWNCCDGRHDVDGIVAAVAQAFDPGAHYDDPISSIRSDVRTTLSNFTEHGLVESAVSERHDAACGT